MVQNRNRTIALLAGCLLIIPLMSCDDSEVIPPTGSTITVAGNPATIILENGVGSSDIIATVRSELGIPLPGQDVRFSASSGSLTFVGTTTPAANIPIPTDSLGNSTVTLTTTTTTTVTATAGNTTGTLTLTATTCNLSQITLNVDTTTAGCAGSTQDVTSCTQAPFCFEAQALCTSGPGAGITVVFSLQNNTVGGKSFNGTFNPLQVVTDATGFARTTFSINADCPTECSVGAGGGPCSAEVLAATQGGFQSDPVPLTIDIP